jgi:ubiquinone/menaquinone biosynthesis C-methylase UbiE
MAGELNDERGVAFYAKHYKTGGWKYSFWREYRWHRRHVIKRFSLKRGMRMLEVACGCGFHTNLFNRMGFDCVGADRSQAGIEWAKNRYSKRTYHCCDFREMPFVPASFDVVIARGFSYYHYDLASDEAFVATRVLMRYLKPGGVFVMIIITDLSGRHDSIWHNTLADYRRHFSSFGKRWSVDWADGMAICALHNEPAEDPAVATTATPQPVAAC